MSIAEINFIEFRNKMKLLKKNPECQKKKMKPQGKNKKTVKAAKKRPLRCVSK